MIRIFTACAVVALGVGAAWADTAAELEQARADWMEAFNAGDGQAVAEQLFTENGRLMPPDSPILEGREAIATYWQGAFDAGVTDLRLTTVSVEDLGDTAILVGTWTVSVPTEDGGTTGASGKDVIVYKRGPDGAWLMDVDIYNDGK